MSSITSTLNQPMKDGSTIKSACPEANLLVSEQDAGVRPGSFLRVLDSFIFLVDRRPSEDLAERFAVRNWQGVSVLGAVASLKGRGSMFAQCGWFTRMPWLWFHIPKVEEIQFRQDSRFRGGELCMWLKTPLGEYAMLLPHGFFIKHWNTTLETLGDRLKHNAFQRWPSEAPRPDWWHDESPDEWPSSKSSGSSRPSLDLKRGQSQVHEEVIKRLRLSVPLENETYPRDEELQVATSEQETTEDRRQPWSVPDHGKFPRNKQWRKHMFRAS
ncbi:hypothetical protein FRC08_012526 [Ceratobasidium sp. 394]|nr:hypothetical protein FRC08_012526 [Ceratobasidium sp. 394]KAG9089631.1 hypothetical protein FS749_001188 [Ceratobasidium sp. UAMH 11750]